MNRQSLDIGRSLTYMFEEEDWAIKFFITAGLILLLFGLLFIFFIPIFLLPASLLTVYMV